MATTWAVCSWFIGHHGYSDCRWLELTDLLSSHENVICSFLTNWKLEWNVRSLKCTKNWTKKVQYWSYLEPILHSNSKCVYDSWMSAPTHFEFSSQICLWNCLVFLICYYHINFLVQWSYFYHSCNLFVDVKK